MLRPDDTLHFFTSPYRRTRETTEGILATLCADDPEMGPSPFKREKIKVYEEPRLREQDFGNFQPCSAEMERMWQERADYGHFFYRIPNGESAADAYDRISGFNESLWRQFGEDDFASVCVLVTHGLMSRIFLMKWYHFSVEYFEDLRNVNHCEFLIMRRNEQGKYILENKLRTWSELRRQRALQLAKERGVDPDTLKDLSLLDRVSQEPRRRWGGCPNGCNHDKNFRIRSTYADLVKSDSMASNQANSSTSSNNANNNNSGNNTSGTATPVPNGTNGVSQANSSANVHNPSFNGTAQSQTIVARRPAAKRFQSQPGRENGESAGPVIITGPQIDISKAREDIVSSPDGTPSFISVEDRLRSRLVSPSIPPPPQVKIHYGRDFGGSYSGHNSAVSDDGAESSYSGAEDENGRQRTAFTTPVASTTSLTTTATVVASTPSGTNSANGTKRDAATQTDLSLLASLLTSLATNSTSTLHVVPRVEKRDQSRARACKLGDHPHSEDEHSQLEEEHEHHPDCPHHPDNKQQQEEVQQQQQQQQQQSGQDHQSDEHDRESRDGFEADDEREAKITKRPKDKSVGSIKAGKGKAATGDTGGGDLVVNEPAAEMSDQADDALYGEEDVKEDGVQGSVF